MAQQLQSSETKESKIMFPEVLNSSDLVNLLKEKQVPVGVDELMDKVKLLDLCYKNLVPQPQRCYRQNRRGQALTQAQIRIYGHSPSASLSQNKSTNNNVDQPSGSASSLKVTPKSNQLKRPLTGDRLKPPPCGDRLKPPPNGDRSPPKSSQQTSPGDRLKPPLTTDAIKSPKRKLIRLSNHSPSKGSSGAAVNGSVKNEANTKRISSSDVDETPASKRIRTDSAAEKLTSLSKDSSKTTTKTITKITWP